MGGKFSKRSQSSDAAAPSAADQDKTPRQNGSTTTETKEDPQAATQEQGAETPASKKPPEGKVTESPKQSAASGSTPAGVKYRNRKGKHGSAKTQVQDNPKPVMKKRRSFYETVDASEILPYLLVGNLPSATDEEFTSRKNVRFVLNLTSEVYEADGEGVEYKSVPLEDDEEEELAGHFEDCFGFINKAKASSDKKETKAVLVHSYFGISRTSAIVLAYLMKERFWTLREAYDHLIARHPSAKPNDGFVVQLLRYEQELHDGRMTMHLKDFYKHE